MAITEEILSKYGKNKKTAILNIISKFENENEIELQPTISYNNIEKRKESVDII